MDALDPQSGRPVAPVHRLRGRPARLRRLVDTPSPTLASLLDATQQTLDTLVGAQTPILMAGFSFGGLVAACLATRRANVRSLALLAPAGHGGARRPRGELRSWRPAVDSGDEEALRETMRHNLEMHMLAAPADDDALAIHTRACLRTRFHSKSLSRSGQLGEHLRALTCPVLLVWGRARRHRHAARGRIPAHGSMPARPVSCRAGRRPLGSIRSRPSGQRPAFHLVRRSRVEFRRLEPGSLNETRRAESLRSRLRSPTAHVTPHSTAEPFAGLRRGCEDAQSDRRSARTARHTIRGVPADRHAGELPGVELFRRERHGVVLTSVGQAYAEQVVPPSMPSRAPPSGSPRHRPEQSARTHLHHLCSQVADSTPASFQEGPSWHRRADRDGRSRRRLRSRWRRPGHPVRRRPLATH